jgi:hypothetical protein
MVIGLMNLIAWAFGVAAALRTLHGDLPASLFHKSGKR